MAWDKLALIRGVLKSLLETHMTHVQTKPQPQKKTDQLFLSKFNSKREVYNLVDG